MTKTIGRVERTGTINFGDAYLAIWEEGISTARAEGGYAGEKAWERKFKRDVFARIVQTLRRIGWTCAMPEISEHDIKHYGGNVARWSAESKRNCFKGDLKGYLDISGRCIKFEMFQNVNAPDRQDHDGRYQYEKERHMPYMLRLEMERTRRRIRDYLRNVFTDYKFNPEKLKLGFNGATALEYAAQSRRESGHYVAELDRARISNKGQEKSVDGYPLENGTPVYTTDYHGRVVTGAAFYSLNSTWQVVTGRYSLLHKCHNEIWVKSPGNVRVKRNASQRRKRIEAEMAKAVKEMKFERAAQLRDVLFPGDQELFNVWHTEHRLYHRSGFSGYTADQSQAGKFTAAEVRGWGQAPNKIVSIKALEAA